MRAFWGLFFLVIGALFLAINFGWLTPDVWGRIWQLWPLLVIALGLRSLIRNDNAFMLSLLVLVAIGAVILTVLPNRAASLRFGPFGEIRTEEWHIGGKSLSGERATFKDGFSTEGVTGTIVDLGGFYDIVVIGGEENTVTADLEGPRELIQQLGYEGDGATIRFHDEAGDGLRNAWLLGTNQKVTGTLTVPRSAALTIKLSGASKLTLRDLVNTRLTVDASGATQIISDNITVLDPTIELSGAGRISLGACTGTARFELSGAGRISTENCTLDKLTIRSSGAGNIDVKGTLKDLDAEASGASKITVPQPSGVVDQDTSGASKIDYR